ncbi:uncharacterized protein LOC133382415 [Rhineura floridana]|uniref:uncharacterized protein LOC133382415 n=1 Tax=Rhineura floridana TaxID=261503 RepID=UPI002AC838B5|nr:uncharacterized protein LOC133382415 [Rhineura floridana]
MAYKLEEVSFSALLSLRSRVDPNRELFFCLNLALKQLSLEPLCIRNNTRLMIAADHTLIEWISGKGDCEITVFYIQGKPQCHVSVATWEQYLDRLCSQPQPLSLGNLLSTRSKLRSWTFSNKALSLACFDEAVKRFSMEPSSIKQDAQMLVECDGWVVKFISGQGVCEISVFFSKGVPEYNIQVKSEKFLERLQMGAVPLSLENLRKVRDGMEEGEIKSCFDLALSKFKQEPRCIQENAKMVVMGNEETLVLCSGKEENQITVISSEKGIHYQVSAQGWWELGARMLNKLW